MELTEQDRSQIYLEMTHELLRQRINPMHKEIYLSEWNRLFEQTAAKFVKPEPGNVQLGDLYAGAMGAA